MATPPRRPAVSVVVATRGRARLLPRLFAALEAQTLPSEAFELVVVDDASEDETPEVLRRLAAEVRFPVRVLREHRRGGPAVARNRGVAAAAAPVVAFTDDDCEPTPGWLAAGVAALEGRGDRVVVGAVGPPVGAELGPFMRTLHVRDARHFPTANVFYPRHRLLEVGGFDPTFTRPSGEDTDLGLRVVATGAHACFAEDALVHHDVSDNDVLGALRRASRWTGLPLVVARHPETRDRLLHRRWFWKPTHPPTLLAVAGLALSVRHPPALLGTVPWVHHRLRRTRAPSRSRAERLASLPGLLLVDAAEVAAMVRGSIRHRTLLL